MSYILIAEQNYSSSVELLAVCYAKLEENMSVIENGTSRNAKCKTVLFIMSFKQFIRNKTICMISNFK